jgi:predicted Rossmann fold nucleotide-binding protein DprA/Smf involved in DNA uptake
MKKVHDELSEVSKALSGLFKKVNKIAKRVNKLGSTAGAKAKRGRKPGPKAPLRAARVRQDTVLDSVYKTIRRSRNGISIAQLKAKTALDDRQLSNALYKLTKKGMIEAKSRGVYVKS